MDAQNAAESIATKPSASKVSPPRTGAGTEPDQSKPSVSTPALIKSSSSSATQSSVPGRDKDKEKERNKDKDKDKDKDLKNSVNASQQHGQDDDAGADNNSEAETIVLAGKDGSPIKSRKTIKREDNSDDDRRRGKGDAIPKRIPPDNKSALNGSRENNHGVSTHPRDGAKRRRLMDQTPSKGSSALGFVPGSPLLLSRGHLANYDTESDSESVHAQPAKPAAFKEKEREARDRDTTSSSKPKPTDRPVPHKRKAPRGESDEEADHDNHKARRQRTSASIDASSSMQRPPHKERDHTKTSRITSETPARHRSISPPPRSHRRSASTQVQSSSGLGQKKKRVPPPLSTDYHSDESSASGSPHIRSATTRGLATPATADSHMASAKNPAHKKHVDAHGQTQLAKACSRGEYEQVKKRLQERPGDLDYPDYAGNTPLQIASINGYDQIVKLLVDSGCDVDCVNHDKDTPLLDAVDNGHLGVVKVLLNAGVNPRKANVNGEEPLDRVDDDMDNAKQIREALIEARRNMGERRKASEERQDHQDNRSSHGADSPRRSPAVAEGGFGSRRAASSRSHKLSNSVLYMHVDDQTLRKMAGVGNVEQVERILQVRDNTDDPEAMVAAARGGHHTVMNLLLALGGANPDPPPVHSVPAEFSTPILAAIGQNDTNVIELLLAQSNFDPTKKFKGQTYHEIARSRAGSCWEREEQLLKAAYDAYKQSRKDSFKKSPNRKEQESKRSGRTDLKDEPSKTLKRKATSPSREVQRISSKPKTGTASHGTKSEDPTSPSSRGAGRPRKDERSLPTIAISDGETSPPTSKSSKPKRTDPETAAMSSEGEANKPRRKLLSGRDIKEQQKNRRASMVSSSSSLREPSSPRDTRHDDLHQPPTEKYHDRAKVLKRDDSRDRLSVSGDHSGKRSRASATPDRGASEKEGEQPVKKRKLDGDKKERISKSNSSPDRTRKSGSARDGSAASKHDDRPARKHGDPPAEKRDASRPRKPDPTTSQSRRESGKSAPSDKSIHVRSEESEIVMRAADTSQSEDSKTRAKEEEKKRRSELEAKRKEKEREKEEAEERKRREDQERREAEAKKREEEKEKQRAEEAERKKQEDIRKRREEEALQQKQREEEQRKAEEAKVRLEKEEEERRKRQEEERARKEQEAADEARRKREEEEERKEQERREQERKEQERKEQERKEQERREQEHKEQEQRRAREEQRQRRMREEQEKKRLEQLPAFLRWLDRSSSIAKTPEMAARWRVLRGVRFDSIRPDTAGTPEGREQWVLNTQVAMLLGDSDIQLTRFSGWERVPAPDPAKYLVMGLAKPKPALTIRNEWDLGRQLPGYYMGKEPDQLTYEEKRQLEEESKTKFLALDLFFVKLSDLMFAVPNVSHLRNLKIVVSYHEVAETLEKHDSGDYPSRWKDDPDAARYMGFCPRNKHFINGQLVHEDQVDVTSASYTPWPEVRVPRYGLTAVPLTDPSYARLAKEQGLEHLLSGLRTPPMTTAAQTSPSRLSPHRAFDDLSPPQSESTATANGDGHHPRSSTASTAEQDKSLVNGNTEPIMVENGANGNS